MRILIINGPNLNLLGRRKPDIYGHKSLEDINRFISDYFKKVKLTFFQSNHEGQLVEQIQQANAEVDGVVLNAGAFTHYSYAIRDAIEAIEKPVIEVHISNIYGRESFRANSVISDVCSGTISGLGVYGYVLAVQALAHRIKREKD